MVSSCQFALQSLNGNRVKQGEVLSALDRQLLSRVVMDDLWDAVKGGAVLAQNILVLLGPGELHVHESLAAPEDKRQSGVRGACSAKHPTAQYFWFYLAKKYPPCHIS